MTEIRERLARLVAFPSVSGSDMGAMLDWLTAEVAPYASLCQRLPADGRDAEALLVRVGEGEGGLVLAGHLDVVPVAGQPWTGEPFTLREADGRYYGRGVCDMKGFFACALALLPQLPPLRAPLWLAISCDEEIGCLSAPRLARALREHGADGAYVWVGEPTLLQPVVAQKGITNLRTIVHGRAAHSSQVGQGASAIHAAARLVAAIEDVMRELQAEGQLDPHFDVPHASLHVGKISGGSAINIVADRCQFDWEIRHLPHETFDALRARVAARERALEAQYPGLRNTPACASKPHRPPPPSPPCKTRITPTGWRCSARSCRMRRDNTSPTPPKRAPTSRRECRRLSAAPAASVRRIRLMNGLRRRSCRNARASCRRSSPRVVAVHRRKKTAS